MNYKTFKEKFEKYLKEELLKIIPKLNGQVVRSFNVGLYPFHAYIEFSILLESEIEEHDEEFEFDIAAWKYYNFNEFQANEESEIKILGFWMEEKFERTAYFQYDKFFRIAADIVNSERVQKVIGELEKSKDFYCSVYDPDDLKYRNYCNGFKRGILGNFIIFRAIELFKEIR